MTKKDIVKNLLEIQLKRKKNNQIKEILRQTSNEIKELIDLRQGENDIQKWVEAHRWLYGKKFSYTNADAKMMLGKKDKKEDKALRPYLTKLLNDNCSEKTVLKCRQCLVGNTTVFLSERGKIKILEIEKIFKNKNKEFFVFSYNDKKNKIVEKKIIDVWKSGKKEILEIKLFNGNKIECSLNEKIWNDKEQKMVLAKKLKVGDELKFYKDSFGKENLGDNISKLLGYFYSDGTFWKRKKDNRITMNFRNTNEKYINEFKKLLISDFREYKHKKLYAGSKKKITDIYIRKDHKIRKLLLKENQLNVINENKKIPDFIMQFNKKQTSYFLNRLFAGDGFFSKRKRKLFDTNIYEIGIGSLSYAFLIQIQILLRRFNIYSSIKLSLNKKSNRNFWKLMIGYKKNNILNFMKKIGIYDKIDENDILELKKEIKTVKKYSRRHEHIRKKENEIVSIKKKGIKETYDITVEETHNFFANGILVSNSELTEAEINENIYLCSTIPYFRVIHLMPSGGLVNDICKEKLTPAIEKSPDLLKLLKRKNQQALTIKEFANGSIYRFESGGINAGGRGSSCDKITFDEYESQNPEIEEIYSEAISHSSYAKRTRISTPLIPKMGIDAKYLEGSQYYWEIKCPKCGKRQEMTFPENVINFFDKEDIEIDTDKEYKKRLNEVYIGCKYCGAYINRNTKYYTETSRWVAKRPDLIDFHNSYKISYFMLAWKTGKEILFKYHNFRFLYQFYNEVLGIAYVAKDANIGKQILEANINPKLKNNGEYYGFMKHISMGVDWGKGKIGSWVVIKVDGHPDSDKPAQIIYIEKITKKSLQKLGYKDTSDNGHKFRVEDLIKKFKVDISLDDANGIGADRSAYLVNKFPQKCFGVFYDTAENQKQKRGRQLLSPKWQAEKVTVSRLNEFINILQEFRDLNKVDIPEMDRNIKEFIEHLDSIVIEKMLDSKTNSIYQIVKSTGADHYAHAYLYASVGYNQIKDRKLERYIGGFG
ncbi:MAG: phage terminase large subunit family protein [Candidatus Helarchaeota archaeon]